MFYLGTRPEALFRKKPHDQVDDLNLTLVVEVYR